MNNLLMYKKYTLFKNHIDYFEDILTMLKWDKEDFIYFIDDLIKNSQMIHSIVNIDIIFFISCFLINDTDDKEIKPCNKTTNCILYNEK